MAVRARIAAEVGGPQHRFAMRRAQRQRGHAEMAFARDPRRGRCRGAVRLAEQRRRVLGFADQILMAAQRNRS